MNLNKLLRYCGRNAATPVNITGHDSINNNVQSYHLVTNVLQFISFA
jgi:hypothetical protein